MASVGRHGKGWRVQVRRKGQPPLSATFPLKKQAEQWGAQREAELVHGRLGILPQHTLGEALADFRDKEAPKRDGGRWERNRLNALLGVDKHGKVVRSPDPITLVLLPSLSSAHLAKYRDRRLGEGVQGTTVRRDISLLASVFRAAREWKWMAHNPFLDFDRPPPKKGRRRGVRQEEIEAMAVALGFQEGPPRTMEQQVAIEFLLAIETGMRDGEMLTIEWPQVHAKHVHLDKTKNGDERDVALSPRARELLDYLRGLDAVRVFTVEPGTRDTLFREARARAKLSGFTFHDSRGEAITRLSKKLDILELADMVGHRDLNSLRHYYRSSAPEVADKL